MLNCYSLKCHFCKTVASPISALHHFTGREGCWAQMLPRLLCSTEVLGTTPANLLFPRGSLLPLVFTQPRYLSIHHLTSWGPASSLQKCNFHPLWKSPWCSPAPASLSLLAGQDGADMEGMHLWRDRRSKMSYMWTSIPDSNGGALWEGPVDARVGALSWRTSSFCRAEAHGTTSRLENWGARAKDRSWSLIPCPSPLKARKLRALISAPPPLSWQVWAPPWWSQVGFFLIPPWQASKDGSADRLS